MKAIKWTIMIVVVLTPITLYVFALNINIFEFFCSWRQAVGFIYGVLGLEYVIIKMEQFNKWFDSKLK